MITTVKKQLLALPVALSLIGGGAVLLAATDASAADRPVVTATKQTNSRPTITGERITVYTGERSAFTIKSNDADGDALTYKFVGYPLKGIGLVGDVLTFDLPEHQREGLHRVTVRVSDGKQSSKASFIVDIRHP